MLNFFSRNRVDINSVTLPNFGWTLHKESEKIKEWINPEQTMVVSLNYFDSKPDLPTIKNLEVLRDFYRSQIVQQNGGLVQVDTFYLKDNEAIKTIFKIPQEPKGMMYLASLTIPFHKFSFVIKIQAPELGMTGVRDAVIADKLMNLKVISISENGYDGWASDPYNQKSNEGTPMNKSEDERYDIDFPDHPLSKARDLIGQIERGIEFGSEIGKAKLFKK